MSGLEDALSRLEAAYATTDAASMALNTPFRKALRAHAASQRLQFSQDSAGNIYIVRSGRDPELAPIAIAFPLDGSLSRAAFSSAFRVFSALANGKLLCDLTLLGWTSVGSLLVGRDIWETSPTKTSPMLPELEQFSTLSSPGDFSLSAIFEVSEQEEEAPRVSGSPVLVDRVRKHATTPFGIENSTRKPGRAPEVVVAGLNAESVACSAILSYSAYISALFDNFD